MSEAEEQEYSEDRELPSGIHCPLCTYDLRGLREVKCPECGAEFKRQELLDPRFRGHDYLFELQPNRNFRSFWRTLMGGLLPRQFWGRLHPIQPVRIGRLLLYATLVLLPGFLTMAYAELERHFSTWAHYQYTIQEIALDAWAQFRWKRFLREYGWVLALPAWPILTFLTLLIFQASMRRAKIKTRHVLRCVVYSFDVVFLPTAGYLCYVVLTAHLVEVFSTWAFLLGFALIVSAPLCILVSWYRLTMSYRQYLQLDRPRAIIIASQVIVVLILLNILRLVALWSDVN